MATSIHPSIHPSMEKNCSSEFARMNQTSLPAPASILSRCRHTATDCIPLCTVPAICWGSTPTNPQHKAQPNEIDGACVRGRKIMCRMMTVGKHNKQCKPAIPQTDRQTNRQTDGQTDGPAQTSQAYIRTHIHGAVEGQVILPLARPWSLSHC
mmetsp:Transcript_4890/g.11384  ORF Transcript_4890/g.11384 Transcript_4890/m.11384 type:complete len:153 (-) Transcript_4890:600-1058(-)